ncbi:MAG: alpha-1,2-fucosyltransferase [Deltaproteobacteria bacterium]
MIITKLRGGLGNQLFQYAAARALALRHSTSLKFDRDWFDNRPVVDTARNYMLDCFAVEAEFATSREILQNRYAATGRNMHFFSPLVANFRNQEWGWYRERHFQFDPNFLKLGADTCLEGYWQSPLYFQDYSEQIRVETKIIKQLIGENASLAELISVTRSVAVHIRRGDYVHGPETSRVHGSCPPSYYRQAMSLLLEMFDNVHFFIFSDDQEWARANLDFDWPFVSFMDNGPENASEDLHLMALCHHHIIANSSFSWWGAWLSRYPDKIVIAPEKWFNDPSINTSDLIPSGWLRV